MAFAVSANEFVIFIYIAGALIDLNPEARLAPVALKREFGLKLF